MSTGTPIELFGSIGDTTTQHDNLSFNDIPDTYTELLDEEISEFDIEQPSLLKRFYRFVSSVIKRVL